MPIDNDAYDREGAGWWEDDNPLNILHGRSSPGRFAYLRKLLEDRMAFSRLRCPGIVGDSYDNALAETFNGYCTAELVRGPARTGPWKSVEDVERATLGWVHWRYISRLDGYLGDLPRWSSKPRTALPSGPTETWLDSNSPSLYRTQDASPSCGVVGVYVGGTRVGKINLAASTTQRRTIALPTFSLRTGTVTPEDALDQQAGAGRRPRPQPSPSVRKRSWRT